MTSCFNFYTFTWIVMLIKQVVRKNALNRCISGETFSKESKRTRFVCAVAASVNHNRMEHKVLNLKLFMRRLLTPRVIHKVHIGPQFEYIISNRFSVSKTLFHSAHHATKLIKGQQVQQATTSYPSDCCRDESAQITSGNYTKRGTCETLRNTRNITFQAL